MKIPLTKTENLRSDEQQTSAGKSGLHMLTVHTDCSHADCANLLHKLGKAPQKLFNNRGMAISKMRASPLFPSFQIFLNQILESED